MCCQMLKLIQCGYFYESAKSLKHLRESVSCNSIKVRDVLMCVFEEQNN